MFRSVSRFFDSLFLLDVNKTVSYLFEKNFLSNQEQKDANYGYKCNLTTLKSKDIPFGYSVNSIKDDTITLANEISKKEKKLGDKEWSALNIYFCILKAFKTDYLRYVILTFVLIVLDAFVKYSGIIYIGALLGTRSITDKEVGIISGLLVFLLKATLLLSDTHLKYYVMRVRAKVIGSINGVSLLRISECDSNSCLNQNNDSELLPKSKISRYQNIIAVDSEFSENAISHSIRMFVFPIRLASIFAVATKALDDASMRLLIICLSTLFLAAVLSLFISTLFKKPFIAHREKRIAETTNIIENSRSLNLTQDHMISLFHNLLSGSRKREMFFGSFRKYFFTLGEVISRSMGYFCYGIISLYVWYSHIDIYKSIEMIIDSAILVPSFYTPLLELCYLIYYISEGNNALSRLAKLMQITRNKIPAKTNTEEIPSHSPTIKRTEKIILHADPLHFGATSVNRIEMQYGVPVILSCNDISYNYILTDFLRRVIFGESGKDGILIKLESTDQGCGEGDAGVIQILADVSNPVCYVPLDPWISDGMSLADIILNGRDYDQDLWEKVLDVCELKNDLVSWGILNYDLARSTIFSQNQFSRGQKVRLSLSRALYGIEYKDEKINSSALESPILILDSIFSSMDPPVCCSILSKLFNGENGLLKNTFSLVIMDTRMLTFLPNNILHSCIHVVPMKYQESDGFQQSNGGTPKSTTSNHTSSSISSIINEYCFEEDLSRDLWELSTEDEIFNASSNYNSNEDEITDTHIHSKYGENIKEIGIDMIKNKEKLISGTCKKNQTKIERSEELIELLPKREGVTESSENSYSTLTFYILKAANRFKYPKNWFITGKIGSSPLEMILYLVFLLLPQLILVFGEKVLLGNLSKVSETTVFMGKIMSVDFLFFTYFLCIVMAILSVITSGILEVYVGLRAANNLHNSFLLGYISSKLSSCIRYLPVSFVLNRMNLDQLTIDYCTTKRVGQFVTAVNVVMASIYLLIMASNYPIVEITLFSAFFYMLYKYVFRYFIHSCRLIHNTYISEISLLVDTVRNICDGRECIKPQKLDKFYLENGYSQLHEIMKPVFIQSSLEAWLKIRLQVGIIIPVTFLNIFSSQISNGSSRVLVALVVATAFSSLGRIDEVVRYLMRLERELVSVERLRKYLELIKDEYLMKKNEALSNKYGDVSYHGVETKSKCCPAGNIDGLVLESVSGYHSSLSSDNKRTLMDRSEVRGTLVKRIRCLNNISAVANKGEIIGIVGRSGSGKTSLLFLIAKSLEYKGVVNQSILSNGNLLVNDNHIADCKLCRDNIDEQIMRIFLEDYNMTRHVAMLPLEVFFNDNTTIRQSVDPLNKFSSENIISALNICGVSNYLIEREVMMNLRQNKSSIGSFEENQVPNEGTFLLLNNDKFSVIKGYLDKKIGELSLPMQIQRMLLFTHYFLRRNEINILLIDEPPVIYCSETCTPNSSSSKKSTLITNIIFKYFSHSITFIVAHDIRNLNGIKKFWYLHQGTLTIKKL
ncbi:putative ABC transporter [Cryptosporidium canis]|uniref:ABC transporter n=1 Tax=Cryptosporidium canis TaxID=195482 RepID=A0A9D5DGC9_9CRYT|nr:putative ABC transporter [Cryptosporidium canis]